MNTVWKPTLALLLTALAATPAWSSDAPGFARMIIFGDSLSDPGNVFVLTGEQSVPPYSGLDTLRVPSAPYATGGHHFSNGKTWIEQLALQLGLGKDARPAFRITGASNYALGGARAFTPGPEPALPNLDAQVGLFVAAGGPPLLPDALVVILAGGNDIRDGLTKAAGGNIPAALGDLDAATTAIPGYVAALDGLGARRFLVGNAPNIGRTPAVRMLGGDAIALAAFLSAQFNGALQAKLGALSLDPDTTVVGFDVAAVVEEVATDPGSAGLEVADVACVTPGVAPFRCSDADRHLFWDGIHPTRAGHAVLKDRALADLQGAGLLE